MRQGLWTFTRCPCVHGLMKGVEAYDRIVYGSVELVATVQEGSRHARDSAVMLQDNGMYRAGRISRFLTHTAPGCLSMISISIPILLMSGCMHQCLTRTRLPRGAAR